jgi:hypothetical protein
VGFNLIGENIMAIELTPDAFQFTVDGWNYFIRAELDAFAGAPTVNTAEQDPSNGNWSWMMLVEASQSEVDKYGGIEPFMQYAIDRVNAELDVRHPGEQVPEDLLGQLQTFVMSRLSTEEQRLVIV